MASLFDDTGRRRIILIRIRGFEINEDHAIYIVEIGIDRVKWQVKRRFKEFHYLHEKLRKEHKQEMKKAASLPPKKAIGNLTVKFVQKRQRLLGFYLQSLVSLFDRIPIPLADFLLWHKYEIQGLTSTLAEHLFDKGDAWLAKGYPFEFSVLQLFAISERLKVATPTCEAGSNFRYDFGHVLSFISQLETVKVYGSARPYGSSNVIMNHLYFDLKAFHKLLRLQLVRVNMDLMQSVFILRSNILTLSVRNSVHSIKQIVLPEFPAYQTFNKTLPVFQKCTIADFSENNITEIDWSICLLPHLKDLNLKRNKISKIANLDSLIALNFLDLSSNCLSNLDDLHLSLGNIKELYLSENSISSLNGLRKLYSLVVLNLSDNQISEFSEIHHLKELPLLVRLTLTENPVMLLADYRTRVLEVFNERACEIVLDDLVASSKELDTVAVLQAIRRGREASLSLQAKSRANRLSETRSLSPSVCNSAHNSDPKDNDTLVQDYRQQFSIPVEEATQEFVPEFEEELRPFSFEDLSDLNLKDSEFHSYLNHQVLPDTHAAIIFYSICQLHSQDFSEFNPNISFCVLITENKELLLFTIEATKNHSKPCLTLIKNVSLISICNIIRGYNGLFVQLAFVDESIVTLYLLSSYQTDTMLSIINSSDVVIQEDGFEHVLDLLKLVNQTNGKFYSICLLATGIMQLVTILLTEDNMYLIDESDRSNISVISYFDMANQVKDVSIVDDSPCYCFPCQVSIVDDTFSSLVIGFALQSQRNEFMNVLATVGDHYRNRSCTDQINSFGDQDNASSSVAESESKTSTTSADDHKDIVTANGDESSTENILPEKEIQQLQITADKDSLNFKVNVTFIRFDDPHEEIKSIMQFQDNSLLLQSDIEEINLDFASVKDVFVGFFGQYVRFVGKSSDLDITVVTRDLTVSEKIISHLKLTCSSVVSSAITCTTSSDLCDPDMYTNHEIIDLDKYHISVHFPSEDRVRYLLSFDHSTEILFYTLLTNSQDFMKSIVLSDACIVLLAQNISQYPLPDYAVQPASSPEFDLLLSIPITSVTEIKCRTFEPSYICVVYSSTDGSGDDNDNSASFDSLELRLLAGKDADRFLRILKKIADDSSVKVTVTYI